MSETVKQASPLEKLLKGKPEQWGETIGKACEEVESKIEALQEELAQARTGLKHLKTLHAAVCPEAATAAKPARKSAAGKRGTSKSANRERIYAWLQEHEPAACVDIANATGINKQTVYGALQHEWFIKDADANYRIRKAGE